MSTDLRSSIHQLVDEIENEQLLETLRDFLALRKNTEAGKLWGELPEEKRQEILLGLEESEDESTLISREDFLKLRK